MLWSLGDLWSEAQLTLSNPRLGARRILALNLPAGARWTAVAIVAIVSTILLYLMLRLTPDDGDVPLAPILDMPLLAALIQVCALVLGAGVLAFVGRMRGGRGSFADALLLFCWLQVLILGLEVIQILAFVLLPPLGNLISLGIVGAYFWLLTNFTMELHGFRSWVAVLGGIILTIIAAFLFLSLAGMTLVVLS